MKLRKLNAFLGLALTAVMLAHCGIMTYSMIAPGHSCSLCKALAHAAAVITVLHFIINEANFARTDKPGALGKYKRKNIRVWIQRLSGPAMLLLLYPHIKAFGFFATGEVLSLTKSVLVCITEILFLSAVFSHTAVSVSRALISLGIISTEKSCRLVDLSAYVLCGALFAAAVYALMNSLPF